MEREAERPEQAEVEVVLSVAVLAVDEVETVEAIGSSTTNFQPVPRREFRRM